MPDNSITGPTAGAALANLLRRYGYLRGFERLTHDGHSIFKAIEVVTDVALEGRETEIPLVFRPTLMEPEGDAVLTSTGNTLSFLLGPVTVALSRHEFELEPTNRHYHDIVVKRTHIELDGEAVWTLP